MVKIKIASGSNPAITLNEVKLLADINNTHDDKIIECLIPTAVDWFENKTGRALITSSWEIYYDLPEFQNKMMLDTLNVTVIEEVSIFDRDNNETVIDSSNYRLFKNNLIFNETYYPVYTNGYNLRSFQAVKVSVNAGYGADETAIPGEIKSAMSQMIAYWIDTGAMTSSDVNFQNTPYSIEGKILKYVKRVHWL